MRLLLLRHDWEGTLMDQGRRSGEALLWKVLKLGMSLGYADRGNEDHGTVTNSSRDSARIQGDMQYILESASILAGFFDC